MQVGATALLVVTAYLSLSPRLSPQVCSRRSISWPIKWESFGLCGAKSPWSTARTHGTGTKRFHHPIAGELTLAYEELAITAEPGLVLLVYTAEPGSPSAERLRLLASWAATTDGAHAPHGTPSGSPRLSAGSAVHDTEGT